MRSLEARHVLQDGGDTGLRLLQALHSLRHVLDRLAEPAGARFDGAHALGLCLELGDAFGDRRQLCRCAVRLGAHVGDGAARLLERPEARLHIGQTATQIDDALADGVEALILELEPLDRPLHFVTQRGQAAAELLVGPLPLLVPRGDLVRALQHVAVEGLELVDLAFELAQALGALLVLVDLGVDLPHQVVEAGHLRGDALDDFALLVERRDLLGDRVGQRLERAELAGGLGRIGGGLSQVLQRQPQRRHAGLGRGDAALDLLLPLLERMQSRGDGLAGPAQLLLPLAHAVESLSDVPHLGGQLVRVHAERLEPAAQLEEAGQVVLEGERLLEGAVQLLDLGAQPFRVFGGMGELRLGASLHSGDRFRLRVQRREHRGQPLQRLHARLQLSHHLLGVGDGLRQRGEVLGGFARRIRQRFERHPLPLHLGENRAELRGELLRRHVLPKELPRGHKFPHRRLGFRGWALEPGAPHWRPRRAGGRLPSGEQRQYRVGIPRANCRGGRDAIIGEGDATARPKVSAGHLGRNDPGGPRTTPGTKGLLRRPQGVDDVQARGPHRRQEAAHHAHHHGE